MTLLQIIPCTVHLAVSVMVLLRGKPRVTQSAAIAEAMERVRAGELGVRVAPGPHRADARAASIFNTLVQEAEGCGFDPRLQLAENNLYGQLRSEIAQHVRKDPSPFTFVAIAEVDRFASLRKGTGYGLSNKILPLLPQRIVANVDDAELGRIG